MRERYIVRVASVKAALKLFSLEGVETERIFPFISACGVAADFKRVERLLRFPTVKSVHADSLVRVADSSVFPHADGGAAEKTREAAETEPSRTFPVTVAVIDTGVDEHLDLTLFPNRIAAFADFVGGGKYAYDDNGHGTAVCGVLAGSFFGLGLYRARVSRHFGIAALKALDGGGEGTSFDILSAMQWVHDNSARYNIRAVNASFGTLPLKKGDPLRLGAEALVRSGIAVIASAGNGGEIGEGILSPAVSPFVIAVGGADGNRPAAFSPRGSVGSGKPDLIAPAVDILTLSAFGGYTTLSGTSMAAPAVSAAIAEIFYRYPSYTPERAKSYLLSRALKADGDRLACGAGLLDPHIE